MTLPALLPVLPRTQCGASPGYHQVAILLILTVTTLALVWADKPVQTAVAAVIALATAARAAARPWQLLAQEEGRP
ncbi:hypothetical protein BAY60_36020 (plasmid) [Prauserella muralis]|uniref:Uncharacterized protein n=1 Tax=Prauserella muralis TaxID=588067 RepID=A0A2V4ABW3_9PSEU|nr:hypothetical protein BAY60_36020 [Prauserella muralis]TWE11152.1 hypothetical protein FHX69_7371 [Prauserella muralis]